MNIESFELFWSNYPRRVAKVCALRAAKKINDSELPAILAGIAKWKLTEQWKIVRFIPHPATFLRQERWKDEISMELSCGPAEVYVGSGPSDWGIPIVLNPEAMQRIREREAKGK
jgi:hypothetical protein